MEKRNYVKIIMDAICQMRLNPNYDKLYNDNESLLKNIDETMQTMLNDINLTKAFCDSMNSEIESNDLLMHYDMSGNPHTEMENSDFKRLKEYAQLRASLNDISTKDIVHRLLSNGKRKINYSAICEEIINVCIKNYRSIPDFCCEKCLASFPTVDTMNIIYQTVMGDSSLEFYRDLIDEFVLNFRYIEDKDTIYLSERLDGVNNVADISSQKSRMLQNLNERIDRLPLPRKDFISRLASETTNNPYIISEDRIEIPQYNKFIRNIFSEINGFNPDPNKTQIGPKLSFRKRDRLSPEYLRPFEIYYGEEMFRPSYIIVFARDLRKKITNYVNSRWTEDDAANLSKLKTTAENINTSQSKFRRKYFHQSSKLTFENTVKMLDDALVDIQKLYEALCAFYENCNFIHSSYNLFGQDTNKTHYPGLFEIVIPTIKEIKDFLTSDEENRDQKQHALIQAAYLASGNQIIFEEHSIFINEKSVISAYNLAQGYGEKQIYGRNEKASCAYILSGLLKSAKKILNSPTQFEKKKIQSQSLNAQKFFVTLYTVQYNTAITL